MVKFQDTWFLLDGSWANAVRNPTPEEKEQLAATPPTTPTHTTTVKSARRNSITIDIGMRKKEAESDDSDSSESEDEPNAGIPSDIIKMEVLRTLQFLLRGGQVNHNMIRQILFLFSALHNSTTRVFLQPFLFNSSKHTNNNRNAKYDLREEKRNFELQTKGRVYLSSSSEESSDDEDYRELPQEEVDKWVSMVSGIRIAMKNVVQLRVVVDYPPPQIVWFPLKTVLLFLYMLAST